MRLALQIVRLALGDYLHERLLSLCAVLALAAVLTPLLILFGVKYGVVSTLLDRLESTPQTLEISPVGSGRYTRDYLDQLSRHPSVSFVLPRTRAIAATLDLVTENGQRLTVSLEPTAAGDPLLQRYSVPVPALAMDSGQSSVSGAHVLWSGLVLSAQAADRLGLAVGDSLEGRFERRLAGKAQRASIPLRLMGILPVAAEQRPLAYAPLPVVEAAEDFRDGRAVPLLGPERGWTGEDRPDAPRAYAGFRLYARTLDDVMRLRDAFAVQHIEVYTQAESIEQIKNLSLSLNLIFSLIGSAAAVGFLASTTSSMLAAVKRKERLLGLLRLSGFSTGSLLLFPLTQSLATALLGTAVACGLCALTAQGIDYLFAASLAGMESICRLLPVHYALALGMVCTLSLVAALGPALRASRVEPSEVIREI